MSRRVERRFVTPEQISRHLLCSICTDVFLDATRLFCSHTFCKKCITHWIKDHNTCPICREEIQSPLMGKDLTADKMIQDLQVSCPNIDCTWKDSLENLEKHYKVCSFSKSPEWLVKDQNYIKIEEESDDNSPSWADLKNFPPIQVSFPHPNGHILARGPEDFYCMTYLHTFYTQHPDPKGLFESVVSHSTHGGRRNSGSGGYAFGLHNNIMIPIYGPVEELKSDPTREDEIIIVDDSTSSSELPSSQGNSQKKKKKSCTRHTKSSRRIKSNRSNIIDLDDCNENYRTQASKMPKIRSHSKREMGKFISLGEDSSEDKLLKKTKAGVV